MTHSSQTHPLKKALQSGAFFMLIILTFSLLSSCEAKSHYVKVKWVYDGDTLLLQDGRKIRLIGINAPEVAHHNKKGEAYGREASEQLRALLAKANHQVRLEIGQEALDRYKRKLAHVFLADGTNVSEWMLQRGLATVMVFPPNTRYINDYRHAESSAQQQGLNIWRQANYKIQKPTQLKASYKGYVRLKGTIRKSKVGKKSIFLELDNKIFIKLERRYLKYFNTYNPAQLLHKDVVVSGRISTYRGKRTLNVRHPVQMNLANTH